MRVISTDKKQAADLTAISVGEVFRKFALVKHEKRNASNIHLRHDAALNRLPQLAQQNKHDNNFISHACRQKLYS